MHPGPPTAHGSFQLQPRAAGAGYKLGAARSDQADGQRRWPPCVVCNVQHFLTWQQKAQQVFCVNGQGGSAFGGPFLQSNAPSPRCSARPPAPGAPSPSARQVLRRSPAQELISHRCGRCSPPHCQLALFLKRASPSRTRPCQDLAQKRLAMAMRTATHRISVRVSDPTTI